MLSRHCSKGAQPVPKTVYHNGCRDKHNRLRCDSNLGPLTPQSDALNTRLLRPAIKVCSHNKNELTLRILQTAFLYFYIRLFTF